ncbi:unnamed protein product, partial [Allacma fusca]
MREALEGWKKGVTLGGKKISNLRYADDTTILAENIDDMKEIMGKIEQVSLARGLKVNESKTKMMIIDRVNDNQPELREIDGIEV